MLHNNTRSGSYPDFGYILQLLSWGFLSIKERLVCLWKQPSSFHSQECKQWWKHTQWKLYNWRFDPNSIWKLNRKLIISKLNLEPTVNIEPIARKCFTRKFIICKLNTEPTVRKCFNRKLIINKLNIEPTVRKCFNRKLIISKLNTESTVRKYFIRKLNIEPIIRKLSRCDPTSTSKPNRSQPNRVK